MSLNIKWQKITFFGKHNWKQKVFKIKLVRVWELVINEILAVFFPFFKWNSVLLLHQSYFLNFQWKHSTETDSTPPPPLPPVDVNEECPPDPCGENANCKVKKVHELLCMQFLQGIVRGKPDCECKEGCKGDPFKKCDCDQDTPPANETQAYPGIHWLYKPSPFRFGKISTPSSKYQQTTHIGLLPLSLHSLP